MSTKYNHFAKELDAAFRTARSEYAAVYDELTKAKENASAAGLDAVKKQIATLQLQEAEKKMRQETGAHLVGVRCKGRRTPQRIGKGSTDKQPC